MEHDYLTESTLTCLIELAHSTTQEQDHTIKL